MEYKVVPFSASISTHEKDTKAAAQLEELANEAARSGWEFIRLERVETHVAGDSGCFGIGATPGSTISISMAVFRR
jgi:hypothetical protein